MMELYLSSAMGLALMLATHFYARRVLAAHRNQALLLNVISGIAIAYAFVDVFPHLARKQLALEGLQIGPFGTYLTHHVYLMGLLGFCVYVGLRVIKATAVDRTHSSIAEYGLVASMCLYALFVGYMLAELPLYRPAPALLFSIAMSAHFLGIDHSLIQEQNDLYDRVLRYLLMASTLVGWLCGFLYTVSPAVFALAFAYIAGGIVAVAAISDLPRVRSLTDFLQFLTGVLAYSALLLVLEAYRLAASQ